MLSYEPEHSLPETYQSRQMILSTSTWTLLQATAIVMAIIVSSAFAMCGYA